MQYKAVFDIPDDVTPPPSIAFQCVATVQTDQGAQLQLQTYRATLMPFNSKIEEYNNNPLYSDSLTIPNSDVCKSCTNHPSNGGSGICHCILGIPTLTC